MNAFILAQVTHGIGLLGGHWKEVEEGSSVSQGPLLQSELRTERSKMGEICKAYRETSAPPVSL